MCFIPHRNTNSSCINTAVWHKRSWLFKYVQFKTAVGRIWTFTMYSSMIFSRLLVERHSINHQSINLFRTCWELTSYYSNLYHVCILYWWEKLSFILQTHHGANKIHWANLFCSHQGSLAGSTPEPNRRYATLPHNLVSGTSSAPSPSLQRRISTNTSNSFYLKNKGRRFNVQLKKGEKNQWIPVISSLSDSYSLLID